MLRLTCLSLKEVLVLGLGNFGTGFTLIAFEISENAVSLLSLCANILLLALVMCKGGHRVPEERLIQVVVLDTAVQPVGLSVIGTLLEGPSHNLVEVKFCGLRLRVIFISFLAGSASLSLHFLEGKASARSPIFVEEW